MIPNLKPHPAYRDSSVPWLGDIPAHWQQLPGRACFVETKMPNVGLQETTVLSLSYGQIVVKPPEKLHGLVPASFETYQIIEPYDIVVRPTDLQNDWVSLRTGLARTRGIITSAYMCLCTKDPLAPEYGHLLLHAYDLKKVFYGLGSGLRQNLGWRDFKYLPCLVPPPEEQAAIVRFLDHIDRRIRRYIRAKRKLILLLEEQKQAIIQRAVTRGLDANVQLKPSGVEWLGDIPEHWESRPFVRCIKESADYRGATPRKTEEGVFLVTAKNVRRGWIDYETSKEYVSVDEYHSIMRRGLPRIRDILLTTEAPLGNVALVDREDVALAQRVIRFRCDDAVLLPEFALNSMLSSYFQNQLLCRATGSTASGIKASKLPQLQILLPSVTEQEAILRWLQEHLIQVEQSIQHTQVRIDLVREYRTRLIADVVTGKLDVREAAANLPDEAEEPEDLDEREEMAEEEAIADDGQEEEA